MLDVLDHFRSAFRVRLFLVRVIPGTYLGTTQSTLCQLLAKRGIKPSSPASRQLLTNILPFSCQFEGTGDDDLLEDEKMIACMEGKNPQDKCKNEDIDSLVHSPLHPQAISIYRDGTLVKRRSKSTHISESGNYRSRRVTVFASVCPFEYYCILLTPNLQVLLLLVVPIRHPMSFSHRNFYLFEETRFPGLCKWMYSSDGELHKLEGRRKKKDQNGELK